MHANKLALAHSLLVQSSRASDVTSHTAPVI